MCVFLFSYASFIMCQVALATDTDTSESEIHRNARWPSQQVAVWLLIGRGESFSHRGLGHVFVCYVLGGTWRPSRRRDCQSDQAFLGHSSVERERVAERGGFWAFPVMMRGETVEIALGLLLMASGCVSTRADVSLCFNLWF